MMKKQNTDFDLKMASWFERTNPKYKIQLIKAKA